MRLDIKAAKILNEKSGGCKMRAENRKYLTEAITRVTE
jgi:hypothetical protein